MSALSRRAAKVVLSAILLSSASGLSPKSEISISRSTVQQRPTLEHLGWAAPGALEPLQTTETSLVAAKKEEPESAKAGYLAVLGGIMIHLACGSMYCWGNLVGYLPASLKYWNPAGGTGPADAQLVLAFILVAQMTGMPFGPVVEKQLGPRLTAAVGSCAHRSHTHTFFLPARAPPSAPQHRSTTTAAPPPPATSSAALPFLSVCVPSLPCDPPSRAPSCATQ